jgi:ribonuclease HIII
LNHVLPLSDARAVQAALHSHLKSAGFASSQPPHTYWQCKGDGGTVTLYRSGKLMVQGKAADSILDDIKPLLGGTAQAGAKAIATSAAAPGKGNTDIIGSDEVGKGDYFGPLVVCAAYIPPDQEELVRSTGATDSKKLTDDKCMQIAAKLLHLPHAISMLSPLEYNVVWSSLRNVNRVLDRLHNEALTQVMNVTGVTRMVTDRYAVDPGLKRALGPDVQWHAEPRAESAYPSVAVASIIARAAFLSQMHQLEQHWDIGLHKGAGAPTLADARRFVDVHGEDALQNVAKLHFRTTQQVVGTPLGF